MVQIYLIHDASLNRIEFQTQVLTTNRKYRELNFHCNLNLSIVR